MTDFLNLHGQWVQTPNSVAMYPGTASDLRPEGVSPSDVWIDYKAAGQHPYDISDFIVPQGGFPDYNHIFLRDLKAGSRPVGDPGNEHAIS